MQFKRQVKNEEGVNLTPLIDVVFLLLIFFMVSTTFTRESHLKVDLPEATGAPVTEADAPIEVIVDANGGFSVNGRALVNSQLSTLRSAIEEVSGGERSMAFIITGDAKASYQAVISVMDTAGQMGFSNLSLTTRVPGEAKK